MRRGAGGRGEKLQLGRMAVIWSLVSPRPRLLHLLPQLGRQGLEDRTIHLRRGGDFNAEVEAGPRMFGRFSACPRNRLSRCRRVQRRAT